ncbi:MAG: ABC transporter permease [Planctomycetota bacterium]
MRFTGRIDSSMLQRAESLAEEAPEGADWRLNLSAVEGIDPVGAAGLVKLARLVRRGSGTVKITEQSEVARVDCRRYRLRKLLQQAPGTASRQEGFVEWVGGQLFAFLNALMNFAVLVYDASYWAFIAPFRREGFEAGELVRRTTRNGFYGVSVLSLVAFLFGLVLSVNGAYLLERWGQNRLIADMIGIGLTREISPVMVGIMLSARSGAALAAEIGTMQVREEISAMWVMGMNPARFIVVPNVVSLALVAPVLVLIANLVGMFGSFLISTTAFGVSTATYARRLLDAITLNSLLLGLGKGVAFGLVVGFIACWFGLAVRGSAEEVGKYTTRTVVWSIVVIIVADGLFAAGLYVTG